MEFRKRTLSSIIIDDESIIDIESDYVEKEINDTKLNDKKLNEKVKEENNKNKRYILTFINLIIDCFQCKYRIQ